MSIYIHLQDLIAVFYHGDLYHNLHNGFLFGLNSLVWGLFFFSYSPDQDHCSFLCSFFFLSSNKGILKLLWALWFSEKLVKTFRLLRPTPTHLSSFDWSTSWEPVCLKRIPDYLWDYTVIITILPNYKYCEHNFTPSHYLNHPPTHPQYTHTHTHLLEALAMFSEDILRSTTPMIQSSKLKDSVHIDSQP